MKKVNQQSDNVIKYLYILLYCKDDFFGFYQFRELGLCKKLFIVSYMKSGFASLKKYSWLLG